MSKELAPQPKDLPAVIKPRKKRQLSERRFVDTISVRTDRGDKFKVPINVSANKAQAQLVGAKLRAVLDKQMDYILHSGMEMETSAMKDLTAAAKAIEEINKIAHSTDGVGDLSVPSASSDIGKMAANMVQAAAKGITEANNSSFNDKLAAIQAAGNKTLFKLKSVDKVVDVEPDKD